mgnify:FL=1
MINTCIRQFNTDHYVFKESGDLSKPHYGKIRTAECKLPLPYDDRKHRINVSLGADPLPVGLVLHYTATCLKIPTYA